MVTHETCFAHWAKEHFQPALKSAHRGAEAFLNRPGIEELRKLDEQLSCETFNMNRDLRQFYVVLSMQSFKRGMPLLPARADEKALTEINAGRKVGLPRWLRYETTKFKLCDYVPEFFRRLGFQLEASNTLDGQKLVPYMFLGPERTRQRHAFHALRGVWCEGTNGSWSGRAS